MPYIICEVGHFVEWIMCTRLPIIEIDSIGQINYSHATIRVFGSATIFTII